jgi:hypothetical protein
MCLLRNTKSLYFIELLTMFLPIHVHALPACLELVEDIIENTGVFLLQLMDIQLFTHFICQVHTIKIEIA